MWILTVDQVLFASEFMLISGIRRNNDENVKRSELLGSNLHQNCNIFQVFIVFCEINIVNCIMAAVNFKRK